MEMEIPPQEVFKESPKLFEKLSYSVSEWGITRMMNTIYSYIRESYDGLQTGEIDFQTSIEKLMDDLVPHYALLEFCFAELQKFLEKDELSAFEAFHIGRYCQQAEAAMKQHSSVVFPLICMLVYPLIQGGISKEEIINKIDEALLEWKSTMLIKMAEYEEGVCKGK